MPIERPKLSTRGAPAVELPCVSVIVTAYNQARYIDECIASIRDQTYTNFECVVVDDRSTDGTREVAEATASVWNDVRLSVTQTPQNLGQLGAQVFGLSRTRGDFVVFVDADDVLHNDFLVRHLFAHLNFELPVGFTSSDQWTINASGEVLSFHHPQLRSRYFGSEGQEVTIGEGSDRPMRAYLLRSHDTPIAFGLDHWRWATQSTMMFRRPLLELILPKQLEPGVFRLFADSYLARFGQLIGGSLVLSEPLGRYRRHGSNFASSLIAASTDFGDMRKHPTLGEHYACALAILSAKSDQFIAAIGKDRYESLVTTFRLGAGRGPGSRWSDAQVDLARRELSTGGTLAKLPCVSVIVTAYNYARYIGECLASIRAQTYTNFECVVVDDRSRDRTREVAETTVSEWNDMRFSVTQTPQNLGQLGAQVFGLSKTRGDFVVFIDADDVLHDNFLMRHLFAHLNFELPVGFTSSDQWTINASGEVLSFHDPQVSRHYGSRGQEVTIGEGSDRSLQAYLLRWHDTPLTFDHWRWATQSTMMFRRPLIELILPDDLESGAFRTCADSYIVRFAQLIGGSLVLREPLGRYRRHGSNNFAGPLIGARTESGDMRKHPTLGEHYACALAILSAKSDQFIASIGEDRYQNLLATFRLGAGSGDFRRWRGSVPHRIFRRIMLPLVGAKAYARMRARVLDL
jgi:glycosyltransferase involved in cell wall biosynthesis